MKKVLLLILMFLCVSRVYATDIIDVDYMEKDIISDNYSKIQAKLLQKELNMVMGCELLVDGEVGPLTKNCVKQFQWYYGLPETGLVGTNTRKALNGLYGADKIIVNSTTLKVRDNPGTSGTNVLFKAHKGDILTVLDTIEVTGSSTVWYYIKFNGIKGYVTSNSKYVRNTFVEVDITSQTLRLYKNTHLILDTPVTTGKDDGRHNTNKGYHYALFKDADRYLQPSNSYVRYWIRFYDPRALGIHDADWRGTNVNYTYFGGTRYKNQNAEAGSKYTGSHGCVNVPVPKMPTIYNIVKAHWTDTTKATPIYVH